MVLLRTCASVRTHLTKVVPRAVKGVFLGYGESISLQKGWRILLPDTGKVVTSEHVRFESSVTASISARDPSLVVNDFFPVVLDSASSTPAVAPVSRASFLPRSLRIDRASSTSPASSSVSDPTSQVAPDAVTTDPHVVTDGVVLPGNSSVSI